MTTPEKKTSRVRTLEERLRDSRIETAQIATLIAFKHVKAAIEDGDAIAAGARMAALSDAITAQIRVENDEPEEPAREAAQGTVVSDAD